MLGRREWNTKDGLRLITSSRLEWCSAGCVSDYFCETEILYACVDLAERLGVPLLLEQALADLESWGAEAKFVLANRKPHLSLLKVSQT